MLLLLLSCAGPDPGDATACNGSEAACDRSLPELTLAMTHNAMSSEEEGWLVPNQTLALAAQLDDGIRAVMLDTWWWEEHPDEPWLCHGFCELGATPLAEGLGVIAAFLEANPREVLVVIFEDHIEPEASVEAIRAAGLEERAILPPTEGPWPTLGELIDADTRLLLTAESGGGGAEWFLPAWSLVTDTPYSFDSPEAFDCSLNRGEPDNALFLVNHWISDPLPSAEDAAVVNQEEVLMDRALRCWHDRGRRPNLLAVDHFGEGALLEVVEALNRR